MSQTQVTRSLQSMHKPVNALAAIVALAALALSSPAAAQGKATGRTKARNAKTTVTAAKAKKVRTFSFTGDEIDADRIRPDGTAIFGRPANKHTSLIRLRTQFIAQIVKSAEML